MNKEKTHAVSLRIPLDLYEYLATKANQDNRHFSQYVTKLLTDKMRAEKGAKSKSC
jgi:hypothetical protein